MVQREPESKSGTVIICCTNMFRSRDPIPITYSANMAAERRENKMRACVQLLNAWNSSAHDQVGPIDLVAIKSMRVKYAVEMLLSVQRQRSSLVRVKPNSTLH